MRPPSVVIAANPYEGELFRRALGDIGLRVELAEGGEGAVEATAAVSPLVVVVAMGLVEVDALELLATLRQQHAQLPIFLVADRDGEVPDEPSALRAGATRLFLRPLEVEALANEVEKLAVEAELASEASQQLEVVTDDEPERAVELEAGFEDEWIVPPRPPAALGRIALKPVRRAMAAVEVNRATHDARAADSPTIPAPPPDPDLLLPAEATPPSLVPLEPTPTILPRARTEVLLPAPAQVLPAPLASLVVSPRIEEPLMRADETLFDAAGLLPALDTGSDLVVTETPPPSAPSPPPAHTQEPWQQHFDERSTFARRLDHELNAAERRLFPDAAPMRPARVYEEYEDALGDIDLDSLGIDTLPGMSAERLESVLELRDRRDALGPLEANPTDTPTSPLLRLASERAAVDAVAAPVDEGGSLADTDLAALLANLHAAGWTGRLVLTRGDGEKAVFFDAGQPVFATSTFLHDRLGDLLYRDGKITREQHAKTRELSIEPGRRSAALFVELGLLKAVELFPTLRRHVEEILYSCFGWDSGEYRLAHEQAAPEDRVRLSVHPWALIVEGVRRKYGLERLVELVGAPDTVLTPTTALLRAIADCDLSPQERVAAELVDGERSLAELTLSTAGLPGIQLSESALYALAWGLLAVGAARVGVEPGEKLGVRSMSTVVTSAVNGGRERRAKERADSDRNERPADRGVERERLLAKRAQVADSDYFAILGVERGASTYEIRRAYERLRGDFAPERFAAPVRTELGDALAEITEVLEEAYRVLADESLRTAYRTHLHPAHPAD